MLLNLTQRRQSHYQQFYLTKLEGGPEHWEGGPRLSTSTKNEHHPETTAPRLLLRNAILQDCNEWRQQCGRYSIMVGVTS